jgi:NADPH-dependent glutamate synthase beta subunit-like oxidoreductase
VDVPRYVHLIAQGKFAEALAVVRERVPFPAVLGHVCTHPCETECRRGFLNEPIAIRALKRFAAEQDTGLWKEKLTTAKPTGKRVAVVGSGPAGLTAAYYLARLGHSVTVFEALPKPGGMMRVGIAEYRLPRKVVDAEIEVIESLGVDIRTNTRVKSPDELLEQGYDAVFLAIGARQGTKIGVEGEDDARVIECMSFLRDVNLGTAVTLGGRVAVIGQGHAAIEASRTALRLGAKKVTIICQGMQPEKPAEEMEDALEEGVEILFLAAPRKIARTDGRVRLDCLRLKLTEPDASGKQFAEPIQGTDFTLKVDTVISALGQIPEIPTGFRLTITEGNTLQVDPDTLATSQDSIFAGGDAVTGPASIIEAIAAGRRAAIAIDRYLGGDGVIDEALAPAQEIESCLERDGNFADNLRVQMPCWPVKKRLNSFAEVKLGFTEEMAVEEARRCLRCDSRLQITPAILPPSLARQS